MKSKMASQVGVTHKNSKREIEWALTSKKQSSV